LLFDSVTNSLYLIVSEGKGETQSLVSSYVIDFNALEAKRVSSKTIDDWSYSRRTRSHLVLFSKNASEKTTDITAYTMKLAERAKWQAKGVN